TRRQHGAAVDRRPTGGADRTNFGPSVAVLSAGATRAAERPDRRRGGTRTDDTTPRRDPRAGLRGRAGCRAVTASGGHSARRTYPVGMAKAVGHSVEQLIRRAEARISRPTVGGALLGGG